MVTRARIRHVQCKITTRPNTVTYGADCLGCAWKVRGKGSAEPMHDACVEHGGGKSGHVQFRIRVQGISYVLRHPLGIRERAKLPKIQVPSAVSDRDDPGGSHRDPVATDSNEDQAAHAITVHPETVTYSADCLGCAWKIRGAEAPEPMQDACMAHAAQDWHEEFRTVVEGFAYVLSNGRGAPEEAVRGRAGPT
ncbi:DUF7848 domain-containing protein [Streptomyces klenkii]|uniref:DUF7848 domain-containing protein n=1 Tax=Streptomyces klenkii TaxID=1420899 RepID=UPI003F68AE08